MNEGKGREDKNNYRESFNAREERSEKTKERKEVSQIIGK